MTGGKAVPALEPTRSNVFGLLLAPIRTDFARKVCQTVSARLVAVVVGVIASVLIARLLGVSGRGVYAVAGAVSALGIQLANLGLHAANTYYVARDRAKLPLLIGNSLAVSAIAGLVLGVLAWVVAEVQPDLLPVRGSLLALCVASIPLGLANLLLKSLLLGVHDVTAYNKVELANTAVVAGAVVILFLVGVARVEAVFAAIPVAAALCTVLSLRRLASAGGGPVAVDLSVVGPMLGYGVKGYGAALMSFLVLRIDFLMVKQMLGEAEAGLYSVAVSMAELIYILPVIVGTILFPKLVATACLCERWQQTRRAAMYVLLVSSVVGLLAITVVKPVVRLLYGVDFLPAVEPFIWLMPAILLLSVTTILNNYLAAAGMPWIVVAAPAAGTALNVLLNWQLLPQFGIVGASIASGAAYGLILGILGIYACRGAGRLNVACNLANSPTQSSEGQ
ncbi:MAG: flippase [Deferrisomatales bacterium]|nr:flippase [Deferrisomatales bacterium]